MGVIHQGDHVAGLGWEDKTHGDFMIAGSHTSSASRFQEMVIRLRHLSHTGGTLTPLCVGLNEILLSINVTMWGRFCRSTRRHWLLERGLDWVCVVSS